MIIGNINTDDYNVHLTKVEISQPEAKTAVIEVPFSDNFLDLTEYLTGGDVKYKPRTISMTFAKNENWQGWHYTYSKIANELHGQRVKIIFDNDKSYYYIGRLSVESAKEDSVTEDIIISGEVDPYKYELTSSLEPWVWNTFDFRTGIIRNYKDLVVNGERKLIIPGRRKAVTPTFECSDTMTLSYNLQTYNLPKGKSTIPDLALGEGEHLLYFKGNGTISVDYRGGSL